MMISIGFLAAFISLAASQCQFFYNKAIGYPIGIERCSYVQQKSGGKLYSYSFEYYCVSEDIALMYTYYGSYTCTAQNYSITTYKNGVNGTFFCNSDYRSCGKLFGGQTPCGCTAYNSDCDYSVEISLVDQVCVEKSSRFYGYNSYEWAITCGSISKANAQVSTYSASDCSGSSSSSTYAAGCHTNEAYQVLFNANTSQMDVIICPGNMASFSLALIAALIAVVLAL